MVEQSKWVEITKAKPEHSAWYIERFRQMAAEGRDLAGEARFVDAMAERESRILDAGCGPGRVGAVLMDAGHTVVGVDVDPELIAAAKEDHPGPTWLVSDLAELDLPTAGVAEGFDVILCVGNVMTFLAASTRREVLRRLRAHIREAGRIVIGFGTGRGYELDEFFDDVAAAGLATELKLGTWDLRPFTDESDFLVAVLVDAS